MTVTAARIPRQLDLQEDAARALADGLRAQIDDLQSRLRESETHLEHLAITRRTVTGLADRLPAVVPDLHPSQAETPGQLGILTEVGTGSFARKP
ncbi:MULTISPECIES: hypothetical protein [Streptomyces]|nr:hypothetical protein [Streptomyces griseus]SED78588.1 hypothetical protein SAMN04490359_1882 [Streptomyces griseus]SQA20999.1 Uncharacterised protein [Streptomyces griseus]